MTYQAKDYSHLIGMKGFSDNLLKNHFTLYTGYVTNTNKLTDTLLIMVKEGKIGTPEYAELKRRFGWEFNGMRLHEYYFGNITKGGKTPDKASKMAKKIVEDFGSYENWEKDFKGTGAMRGIGWVVLYFDPEAKKLFNVWINEHDLGHLAGCNLLLVMDVFEHAFMLDYGTNRAEYIKTFFENVDWNIIEKRFKG